MSRSPQRSLARSDPKKPENVSFILLHVLVIEQIGFSSRVLTWGHPDHVFIFLYLDNQLFAFSLDFN